MQFFHILPAVITLLQREGRVTYQALKLEFGLDEAFLDGMRDELIYAKRCAVDEDGIVLVWTGTPAAVPLALPPLASAAPEHRAARPLPATPANFAAGPILPSAFAAEKRTVLIESFFNRSTRASTAAAASDPRLAS